jgi:hypothetical protein
MCFAASPTLDHESALALALREQQQQQQEQQQQHSLIAAVHAACIPCSCYFLHWIIHRAAALPGCKRLLHHQGTEAQPVCKPRLLFTYL